MGVLYPEDKEAYKNQGCPQELKETLLRKFQGDGFYLLDLLDIPKNQYRGKLKDAVPDLIRKIDEVVTKEIPIILIKVTVYDAAKDELRRAGFRIVPVRIAFPLYGLPFKEKFIQALEYAGVRLKTGLR